jgi:hypothetical protein
MRNELLDRQKHIKKKNNLLYKCEQMSSSSCDATTLYSVKFDFPIPDNYSFLDIHIGHHLHFRYCRENIIYTYSLPNYVCIEIM